LGGKVPGDTSSEPGFELISKFAAVNARTNPTYTSIQDFRLRLIVVGIGFPSSSGLK
jgi:hypothetical protein